MKTKSVQAANFHILFLHIQVRSSSSAAAEDEDVVEERRRISEMKLQEKDNSITDRLVVENLTKVI